MAPPSTSPPAAAQYAPAPDYASAAFARPTLPGTPILLGDGETIWREYHVSQLRTREIGEGTLFVTDARIVFFARARGRGTQRASALVQQTKLGDVTGLTAYVSRRLSLGWMVVVLVLALALISSLWNQSWTTAIVLALLLAISAGLLVRGAARRGTVGVQIHSGATQQSPISFGQFGEQRGAFGEFLHSLAAPFLSLLGVHTAFDVLIGFPCQDAEQVIAELGALVFDLQSRGSLAGPHWGVAAR